MPVEITIDRNEIPVVGVFDRQMAHFDRQLTTRRPAIHDTSTGTSCL
jgi:hypothetical protein